MGQNFDIKISNFYLKDVVSTYHPFYQKKIIIVLLSQSTKSRTAQTYFLICFTCGNTIRVTSGTNGATKWKCPGIGCTHLALTTSFFTVYTWQVSSDKFFTANITTFGIAGWSRKINKKDKGGFTHIVESYYHKILVIVSFTIWEISN